MSSLLPARGTLLCDLGLLIWGLSLLMTSVGTLLALLLIRRPRTTPLAETAASPAGNPPVPSSTHFPITILKPLKGVDDGLEENLRSFFEADYPERELIFSVADGQDPAAPLVRGLIAEYPQVPARLIVGDTELGPNPKVNNLARAYERAAHEWILISDSNTRIDPGFLRRWAAQIQGHVAMQTAIIAGTHGRGLGGRLEATFLNTHYARYMVLLYRLGHPAVMGKAMMFERSVLDWVGGLPALAPHIAEDYAAGKRFLLSGYQVQVARDPIPQYIGRHSLGDFWSRHVRWGRLRKLQAPLAFAIEPFFCAIGSGLIGAASAAHLTGWPAPFFFALHLALWAGCDLLLMRRMGQRVSADSLGSWALRELLHLPLWVKIAAGNTIDWRGQLIRLKR